MGQGGLDQELVQLFCLLVEFTRLFELGDGLSEGSDLGLQLFPAKGNLDRLNAVFSQHLRKDRLVRHEVFEHSDTGIEQVLNLLDRQRLDVHQ